jgi:hypothetical protein
MVNAIKQIEKSVSFKVILGPILILLSLSMLFLKGSTVEWPLPLLAIAAIPLCWQWRWSGLVIAFSCIAAFVAMTYQKAPLSEILWFSGFSLSLALACVTSLLSWEELEVESVESVAVASAYSDEPPIILETAVQDDKVMQGFELESLLIDDDHSQKVKEPPIRSDSNSKDCVNLSSSTAVSRIMPQIDMSVFHDQIQSLTQSLNEMRAANQEYADSLYAQHVQYEALHNEKDSLAEDVNAIRHECQEMRVKLQTLEEQLIEKHHQVTVLNEQHAASIQMIHSLKNNCKEIENERDEKDYLLATNQVAYKREIEALEDRIAKDREASTRVISDYQAKVGSLEEQLKAAGYERDEVGKIKKNTRSIESMYVQLKKQFDEKSKTLDDTRRELFQVNEQLLTLEREQQEQTTYGEGSQALKALLETQTALEEEIEHLNDLVATLSK